MNLKIEKELRDQFNEHRNPKAWKSLCHAPSKGMYFGMRGEVMVCCTNRSHLAGRYPQMSIKECWSSPEVLKIRKDLKEGDMSNGCKICLDMIIAGNYQNMMGRIYDDIPENENGYPSRFDFELHNTCNLECVMCRGELSSAIRKNRDKLPAIEAHYDDNFIAQLEEFIPHLHESYFAGGEPFLIKMYYDIWEKMIELNPNHHISIQTNATVLNERVKNILERLNASIAISIDAVSKDLLESIRKNANWEEVKTNLEYFKEYCTRKNTILSISYTPMTKNIWHLAESVYFCNENGIQIFYNSLSYPKNLALSSLDIDELKRLSAHLHKQSLPENSSIESSNKKQFMGVLAQIDYLIQKEKKFKSIDNKQLWLDDLERFMHSELDENTAVEVSQKVKQIISELESKGESNKIWNHLQSIDFASIAVFIPGKSIEELYRAFYTAIGEGN